MKSLPKMFRLQWGKIMLAVLGMGLIVSGCSDDAANNKLGALPSASFTATPLSSNPSKVVVTNTTEGAFLQSWDFGNGQTSTDKVDTVSYNFKGNYNITLTAFGHGGEDTTSKQVSIEQNNPNACQGTVLGFIAGCTQKSWKLNPAAGAEKVGPAPGDGSYFGNTSASVTGTRACDFNDEWTFSFDEDGNMTYDNKGDFFEKGYLGTAGQGCGKNSDLTSTQKPWASGDFHFKVIPNAGTNPESGQLKVIDLGAHIGLQSVVNGPENTEAPVQSITYDIIGMEHKSGYDLLTLTINASTDGSLWWTFTLRSDTN